MKLGYDRIALRRSRNRNRIFSYLIPVFQPEPEFLKTIPVPVVPEPEFSETNPVPARTGFQYQAGIPAGTGILPMTFRQKPESQKRH